MKPANILDQARAKLIWGESEDAVREFLTTHGFSSSEAEIQIAEFRAERHADIRKTGIKKIVIGSALTAAAIAYFCTTKLGTNTHSAKGAAFILLGGLYGSWKLIDGIIYLVRPQSETKSITEIQE